MNKIDPHDLIAAELGRGTPPSEDQLRSIARHLFRRLDMTRAFESDYIEAVRVLRAVYEAGAEDGAGREASMEAVER